MEKELKGMGDEVNEYVVKAQCALASYNFYKGNRVDIAKQADIDRLRDLFAEAEYLSRVLIAD